MRMHLDAFLDKEHEVYDLLLQRTSSRTARRSVISGWETFSHRNDLRHIRRRGHIPDD